MRDILIGGEPGLLIVRSFAALRMTTSFDESESGWSHFASS